MKSRISSLFLGGLLLSVALTGCGGGGGGGGGGSVSQNTGTSNPTIIEMPAVTGTWQGTWTSENSDTSTWCADMEQNLDSITGSFYISGAKTAGNIFGKVLDPGGNPVAGATLYIPDPGGSSFPETGYPLTGQVAPNTLKFNSPDAGNIRFEGGLDAQSSNADGSYTRLSPPDQGSWQGSRMTSNSKGCLPCETPVVPYFTFACTDENGEFVLDASSAGGGASDISVFKGLLQKDSFVATGQYVTITLEEVSIAVVTGAFDRIEDLLAKLGMGELDFKNQLVPGSETFDLYDGVNVEGWTNALDGSYQNFDDLLFADNDGNGWENIYDYSVVFINCGNTYEDELSTNPLMAGILRDYVASGGKLYITDLSYDFLEQIFPDYVEFLGDDATINAAERGDTGITVNAVINDALLPLWLDRVSCEGMPCLNDVDGTVSVEGFLDNWAVMEGIDPAAPSAVKTWIEGPVSWNGGAGTRPLTIMFDYGAGEGTVLFTSYHTLGSWSPGFSPQERILQYLAFYLL